MLKYEFKINELKWPFKLIIIDECSTIGRDLYEHIKAAHRSINFSPILLFLGDVNQLPPVKEQNSLIFDDNLPQVELTQIVRAKNKKMADLYRNILDRNTKYYFPFCFVEKDFVEQKWDRFMQVYYESIMAGEDSLCLAYSNKKCDEINHYIKTLRDPKFVAEPAATNKGYWSSGATSIAIGDRIVVDQPLYEPVLIQTAEGYTINGCTEKMIYSGEVLEVINMESSKIATVLNQQFFILSKYGAHFSGTILTVRSISDGQAFKICWLDRKQIGTSLFMARKKLSEREYGNLYTIFNKTYSSISYGYAITIYKSQGSTYAKVWVDLSNIYYCFKGRNDEKTMYRSIYTAVTRAAEDVFMYWS